MNILYLAYKVDGVLETPTSLVYNHLNRHHRVYMADGHHNPLSMSIKFDWGITVHENVTDILNCFRLTPQRYVHLEWLVPWCINQDVYGRDWGYTKTEVLKRTRHEQEYRELGKLFLAADKSSLASKYFVEYMSKVFEADLTDVVKIKYPSADAELCEYALHRSPIEKPDRTITTVSRLVPHKGIINIAKALAKWNEKVVWNLVGQGSELEHIVDIVKNTNIDLRYRGWINGVAKLNLMKNSLCVHGWNGIQPAESLLVESFNISMDDPVMQEYYGNSIAYYTSVDHLAEIIDYYWRHEEECVVRAKDAKKRILENKLNINTTAQEAEFMLEMLNG